MQNRGLKHQSFFKYDYTSVTYPWRWPLTLLWPWPNLHLQQFMSTGQERLHVFLIKLIESERRAIISSSHVILHKKRHFDLGWRITDLYWPVTLILWPLKLSDLWHWVIWDIEWPVTLWPFILNDPCHWETCDEWPLTLNDLWPWMTFGSDNDFDLWPITFRMTRCRGRTSFYRCLCWR